MCGLFRSRHLQSRTALWEAMLLMRPVDLDDVMDELAAAGTFVGRATLSRRARPRPRGACVG